MIFDRYRSWFRELSTYHRHMSWQEFWIRYAVARMRSKETEPGPEASEDQARQWYATNEYLLLRQAYYHRTSRWPEILRALRGDSTSTRTLLEYGCGIAPVSAWLADRIPHCRWATTPHGAPGYHFTLVDLPSPALAFAHWRMLRRGVSFHDTPVDALPIIRERYDVIVCLEVLEHVPNPASVMRHLVAHLRDGGTLFVNFVGGTWSGMNLRSAQEQREEAVAVLDLLRCERPLTAAGDTGIYHA